MYIQDAIKSGKPFRRPIHLMTFGHFESKEQWFFAVEESYAGLRLCAILDKEDTSAGLRHYVYIDLLEDAFANDWEVKPDDTKRF